MGKFCSSEDFQNMNVWGLEAEIGARRLGLGPGGWDRGFEAGIEASILE